MPGSDPAPQSAEAERAAEDESRTWGDRPSPDDEALLREKPPHWG